HRVVELALVLEERLYRGLAVGAVELVVRESVRGPRVVDDVEVRGAGRPGVGAAEARRGYVLAVRHCLLLGRVAYLPLYVWDGGGLRGFLPAGRYRYRARPDGVPMDLRRQLQTGGRLTFRFLLMPSSLPSQPTLSPHCRSAALPAERAGRIIRLQLGPTPDRCRWRDALVAVSPPSAMIMSRESSAVLGSGRSGLERFQCPLCFPARASSNTPPAKSALSSLSADAKLNLR
ncbi:hypothetical protein THAOC_31347, partial [Thalassiosira oceanica]